MRRVAPVASILILALAASARADVAASKPVTVPFEMLKTKHMAIMIKVNGKGPYRVIFDTGSPVVLLNNKTAKNAGEDCGCEVKLPSPVLK